MTVSLYTGHVGSGKTYEVVKFVIIPALQAGRDVVSNIDGLNVEAFEAFLEASGCLHPGNLLVVGREDVARPDFFPSRRKDGTYVASQFVPLGALVVVDEAHHIWGSDHQIKPEHMLFFSEHRHITGPSGVACDLVLITQAVGQLALKLKRLVQYSHGCKQLRALGLSKKYSTATYDGYRQSAKYVMSRATKSYDPKIFKLYSSFAAGAGKVMLTDKRFVIWNNWKLWVALVGGPIVLVFAGVHLWHSVMGRHSATVAAASAAGAAAGAASATSSGVRAVPAALPAQPVGIGGESKGPLSVWHIAGRASFGGFDFVVIRRSGFPLRYVPARFCLMSFHRPVTCRYGGETFEPEGGESAASSGEGKSSTWAVDKLAAKSIKAN